MPANLDHLRGINVFDKVYYEAEPGIARPLRTLSDSEEAVAEK